MGRGEGRRTVLCDFVVVPDRRLGAVVYAEVQVGDWARAIMHIAQLSWESRLCDDLGYLVFSTSKTAM